MDHKKIDFSKEEIDYIKNAKEDVAYVSTDVKHQIKKLCKKGIINQPQKELQEFCQSCNNNWKVVPMRVANAAIAQTKSLLNAHKNKLEAKKYNKVESVLNRYHKNLETKKAQFFFKANDKAVDASGTQFFNDLVVRDVLRVENLFRTTKPNGELGFRAGHDNHVGQAVVSRIPVRVNFQPTNPNAPHAFSVVGTTSLRSLVVNQDTTIKGTLNVNTNIFVGGSAVVLNAANVGNGTGLIFQSKSGNNLQFRSLVAGTNIIFDTSNNDQITISAIGDGTGDVVGPASATNNAIAKFNGNSGKSIQNSGVIIDSSNNISTPGNITAGTGFTATTGDVIISSGNLNLTNSTSSSTGNITKAGAPFIHNFGTTNTFVGINSGNFSMLGASNTAVGSSSLQANTSGFSNVAAGESSLNANTTGNFNTAVGRVALGFNTTGQDNTAVGHASLSSNTTANNNTAVGSMSLRFNTTGDFNTAVGNQALQSNDTGASNVAVGDSALRANDGNFNTAVGTSVLLNNNGTFNTGVGASALSASMSGNSNIAIGFNAGSALTGAESNNILIGTNGIIGDNDTIRIGDAQATCFIQGIVGATTGINNPVYIDAAGQLTDQTNPSSKRYKRDINDMNEQSADLMRLRPVSFKYNKDLDKSESKQYGLVAEEVEQVIPELVIYKDDQPESVKYHVLPILLLNELQRLRKEHSLEIGKLNNQITQQNEKIVQLESQISGLKK